MEIPVDTTYKDVGRTEALDRRIREWVDKLERVFDRIVRCEVLIETPHRHHRQGRAYHVRVRLTVPGGELVASHDPGPDGAHEDVYVALRDAFTAARRQLEDHVSSRLRHEGKVRVEPAHARVTFLDVEREWGWLEPGDGRRVYFHRNSVQGSGGIEALAVGDEVRFTEEPGDRGPQASTVEPIGKYGRHELAAT
ncbi:MAG TPA: HPF/RaiA family ribosome-associated protein [Kofleriaceae bacterium]|nr:HPF/RaiA family ribosome-associated protein [Kofleriaceae bacterium]